MYTDLQYNFFPFDIENFSWEKQKKMLHQRKSPSGFERKRKILLLLFSSGINRRIFKRKAKFVWEWAEMKTTQVYAQIKLTMNITYGHLMWLIYEGMMQFCDEFNKWSSSKLIFMVVCIEREMNFHFFFSQRSPLVFIEIICC